MLVIKFFGCDYCEKKLESQVRFVTFGILALDILPSHPTARNTSRTVRDLSKLCTPSAGPSTSKTTLESLTVNYSNNINYHKINFRINV